MLGTWKLFRRGLTIVPLALTERLLTPAVAYWLVSQSEALALAAAVGVSALFGLRGLLQRSFAARNEAELYTRIVDAALHSDVLESSLLPDEETRGGLFSSLHRVGVLLGDTVPNLAANVLACSVLAVMVGAVEPARVTLVACGALGVGAILLLSMRTWMGRAQSDLWAAWGVVADGVSDVLDGRLELVAAGREDDFFKRFSQRADVWSRLARRAGRIAGASGRLPLLVLAVGVGAAVTVDAHVRGAPWTGAARSALLLASMAPAFVGVAHGIQELLSHEKRLHLLANILNRRGPLTTASKTSPPPVPLVIEWKRVTFAYRESAQPALRDLSMTWRTGEVLALCGPNGSGKSTCLRTLLGLGALTSGSVAVDGVRVADMDVVHWRQAVAFLPQRPYLPPRATVREALRFVDADTSEAVIRESLERVGLAAALRRRREHDPAGVGVASLSTGEKQRVALARALCRKAPIILLDEPDSNLDREGILLVARLITELGRNHMVLVTAHAPEVLAAADRVVTLTSGTVSSETPGRRVSSAE